MSALIFLAAIAIPLNVWYYRTFTPHERRALDEARNPGDW